MYIDHQFYNNNFIYIQGSLALGAILLVFLRIINDPGIQILLDRILNNERFNNEGNIIYKYNLQSMQRQEVGYLAVWIKRYLVKYCYYCTRSNDLLAIFSKLPDDTSTRSVVKLRAYFQHIRCKKSCTTYNDFKPL